MNSSTVATDSLNHQSSSSGAGAIGGAPRQHQLPHHRRTHHDRLDLICKVKYSNTLPDLPFEPKFLKNPFSLLNRLVPYRTTSLEKQYKWELLTEPDLGVKIDLIDPMTYYFTAGERVPLHPVDEKLLEDESSLQHNTKRSIQHRKVVPWMRKTEYISMEHTRYGAVGDKHQLDATTRVGAGLIAQRRLASAAPTTSINQKKQQAQAGPAGGPAAASVHVFNQFPLMSTKDRAVQLSIIERTFEDAKRPVRKHFNKRGVVALEEFPILPDFEVWKHSFAQVIFDSDPLPYCKDNRNEHLTNAIIRGMMDTEGHQFVGYFAPTTEALTLYSQPKEQQREDEQQQSSSQDSGSRYEHQLEREYNWTVTNRGARFAGGGAAGFEHFDNYFFVVRPDGKAYYNELDSRVRLVRRAKSTGAAPTKKSILSIKHRPPTTKERKAMDSRLRHLLNPYEGAEEEVEEDDEQEEEEVEEKQKEEGCGDEREESNSIEGGQGTGAAGENGMESGEDAGHPDEGIQQQQKQQQQQQQVHSDDEEEEMEDAQKEEVEAEEQQEEQQEANDDREKESVAENCDGQQIGGDGNAIESGEDVEDDPLEGGSSSQFHNQQQQQEEQQMMYSDEDEENDHGQPQQQQLQQQQRQQQEEEEDDDEEEEGSSPESTSDDEETDTSEEGECE